MSVTINITAAFGSSRTGLVGRVAYSLDGGTTWVPSGITEPVAGSGNYQASVTVTPPLVVNWKTGDADRVSTTLTLTAAGTGYTNGTGYALTFTGGGGTGAAGTFDVVNGAVGNLVLTNQGSGYTSAPTITFTTAGAGSGATATAALVTQRYASEAIAPVVAATVTLPATPPQGYGNLSGTGTRIITQDYGGLGNYSAIDALGNGIGGSTVTAFLTTDYNTNGRNATPLAQTVTTASGQWQTALMLAAGSYTLVYSDRGYLPNPVSLTVT